jgi:hypothetical protein
MVPFQNCVRQRRPVSKMATITKNRHFFKWPKLLYFKPESAQIWTHLGYRTALTDTILKGDHLRIISAKFGWDWLKCQNLNGISIMMSFLTYTVKPVYSGHLGEFDKMTTINRWPLYEGVWLFDEIFCISWVVELWARRRVLVVPR